MVNTGWAAWGLIAVAFCLAFWVLILWPDHGSSYDPWHEQATPYPQY